jgi:hypothetical protein
MKTDALIAMLSRGPVDADPGAPGLRLAAATVPGLALATLAMLLVLGPRPDLARAVTQAMFWLKLGLPLALAAAAFVAASRLARPGDRATGAARVGAALLVVLWAAAVAVVIAAPGERRLAIVLGTSAWPCVIAIAALSLPLLCAAFAALRSLAPTRPREAGWAAGALAGGLAASVYAVHCTETTLPFLALWYVLGMAVPAFVGAALGPSLLRWR